MIGSPPVLPASRRAFLRNSALLLVGFTLTPVASIARAEILGDGPVNRLQSKTLDPGELDAFLALGGDGTLTLFTGKVNLGTGNTTALAQMVAEELDFPVARVTVIQGDTALTVDQGPTNGSMSIQGAGIQLRQAAATAAQALRQQAGKIFRVPVTEVIFDQGVASVSGQSGIQSRPYHALVEGRAMHIPLDPHAPLKNPVTYKVVGKPIFRQDIEAKMFAEFSFMQDFRVPDMVHARVVHPNAYGAQLLRFDDGAARKIPGFLCTVRMGNLIAAIATNEWSAICASKALVLDWSEWTGLPEQSALYDAVRALPVHDTGVIEKRGDVRSIGTGAQLAATYNWPLQTHGSIGPSCSVARYDGGKLTVWSATQAPHMTRDQIAAMMQMNKDDVRLVYVEGAGCYGRNGHEDAAAEAALLCRAVGKPVRVQWMREDEHGWDPKAAPIVTDIHGALDPEGNIIAWSYETWLPYRVSGNADVPLLAGELMRSSTMVNEPNNAGGVEFNIVAPYDVPNMLVKAHRTKTTPLRPAWLRGPGRVQHTFCNESFMDELSVLAGIDPIAFRLKHFQDERAHDVLHAVSRRANWQPRPLHAGKSKPDGVAKGRGMACVRYQPNLAYVASVIDVEVEMATGVVRVTHVYIAHDCGLMVNPDGVLNQVQGEVVQTISRTLFEEVNFSRSAVTSVDWLSYRLLKFPELPDVVDIELIDRPDKPPVGAGEPACAVIPSAIASAIFDAIGTRPRTIPFTPRNIRSLIDS